MASSKPALCLAVCAFFGLLAVGITWRQNAKLSLDNQALRSQIAESQSNPTERPASNEISAEELDRLRRDAAEVVKLRGEVSQLRRERIESDKLKEENVNLRARVLAAADSSRKNDGLTEQQAAAKQIGIAKLNYTRGWLNAFRQYAAQNQGQMPTDFDQARPFLSPDFDNAVDPNQYEIVYHGTLQQLQDSERQAQVIVLRERQANVGPDGVRTKAYAFADGHSEVRKEPPEGFDEFEKRRILVP
jgi:hypothetical protein